MAIIIIDHATRKVHRCEEDDFPQTLKGLFPDPPDEVSDAVDTVARMGLRSDIALQAYLAISLHPDRGGSR